MTNSRITGCGHKTISLYQHPPLLSFGEYPYHPFAAPLSSTPCFPSPVSPACVDISARGETEGHAQQPAPLKAQCSSCLKNLTFDETESTAPACGAALLEAGLSSLCLTTSGPSGNKRKTKQQRTVLTCAFIQKTRASRYADRATSQA